MKRATPHDAIEVIPLDPSAIVEADGHLFWNENGALVAATLLADGTPDLEAVGEVDPAWVGPDEDTFAAFALLGGGGLPVRGPRGVRDGARAVRGRPLRLDP